MPTGNKLLLYPIRRLLGSVLFYLAGMIPASVLAADSCQPPTYGITGIQVDAEAATSDLARKIASDEAVNIAWQQLAQRLLVNPQQFAEKWPAPDDDSNMQDPSALLDFIHIIHENIQPGLYGAKQDFCFDRAKVRQWFEARDLEYAETPSGRLLVLAVWNHPLKPRLWTQPNPWSAAWERVLPGHDGLLRLAMPEGIAIERFVDVEAVLEATPLALSRAAKLEEAQQLLITIATPKLGVGTVSLEVETKLFQPDGTAVAEVQPIRGKIIPVTDLQDSLDQLASEILGGMESIWRQATQLDTRNARDFAISIEATSLAEWTEQLAMLESHPLVLSLFVQRLHHGGGTVVIRLGGKLEALQASMAQRGLWLQPTTDKGQATGRLSLVKTKGE